MILKLAPAVSRLLIMQCLVGFMLAVALTAWKLEAAYSALVGAAIGVIPNFFMAIRVFDLSRGRDAHSTLAAVYAGAAGKFLVTAALFSVAFLLISPLHAPSLFVGFVATQICNWVLLAGKWR